MSSSVRAGRTGRSSQATAPGRTRPLGEGADPPASSQLGRASDTCTLRGHEPVVVEVHDPLDSANPLGLVSSEPLRAPARHPQALQDAGHGAGAAASGAHDKHGPSGVGGRREPPVRTPWGPSRNSSNMARSVRDARPRPGRGPLRIGRTASFLGVPVPRHRLGAPHHPGYRHPRIPPSTPAPGRQIGCHAPPRPPAQPAARRTARRGARGPRRHPGGRCLGPGHPDRRPADAPADRRHREPARRADAAEERDDRGVHAPAEGAPGAAAAPLGQQLGHRREGSGERPRRGGPRRAVRRRRRTRDLPRARRPVQRHRRGEERSGGDLADRHPGLLRRVRRTGPGPGVDAAAAGVLGREPARRRRTPGPRRSRTAPCG